VPARHPGPASAADEVRVDEDIVFQGDTCGQQVDAISDNPVSIFKHDEQVEVGIWLEIAARLGAKQPNADDAAIAPLCQAGCEFLKSGLLVGLQVGG